MKKYSVTFIQYHDYPVEAESETEAEDKAYKMFYADMCSSVSHTYYDDCETQCIEYLEEDE